MFMVVRFYIAKYIRNTQLSRNQTFKKAFDTNGRSRHLNIVYHVPHSYLVISSQIKHWFFLYFVNGDRSIFRKNAHVVGKIEINIAIVSQTWKFRYNDNKEDFVNQKYLRKSLVF